jgi:hypothetical protein
MTDADVYFEAEVGELQRVAAFASQRRAEALAAERAEQKRKAEAAERGRKRRQHTVEVDDACGCGTVSVCLLDVEASYLRAALGSGLCDDDYEPPLNEAVMREARTLYLMGRKVDAMDVLYPALRDALEVAV